MAKFKKILTGFKDITLIEPVLFKDDRGYFFESYNRHEFEQIGIHSEFVQDNYSSSARGVIRGLHFQTQHPQEKLVRVIRGSVFDVAVDIRRGSPSYGRSLGVFLSGQDYRMIHIPIGFAHGFLALEDDTEVMYKTSEFYHPEYDAGIFWQDPDLSIPWPLETSGIQYPLVSEKDRRLPLLRNIRSPFNQEVSENP